MSCPLTQIGGMPVCTWNAVSRAARSKMRCAEPRDCVPKSESAVASLPKQLAKTLRRLILDARPAMPQRPGTRLQRCDPHRHPAADGMAAAQFLERLGARLAGAARAATAPRRCAAATRSASASHAARSASLGPCTSQAATSSRAAAPASAAEACSSGARNSAAESSRTEPDPSSRPRSSKAARTGANSASGVPPATA